MTIKQEIQQELEQTRVRFLALVNSIPESDYSLPSKNSAWTIGDVLFHITLGPRALAFEIWMIVHMRGLFQFGVKFFPSKLFNQVNTRFARRGERVSRQSLTKAYGRAHAAIRSRLRRTRGSGFFQIDNLSDRVHIRSIRGSIYGTSFSVCKNAL